jgi:SAM-dependent methyltransferase
MSRPAAYDSCSDWYEDYVHGAAANFTTRVQRLVVDLLGAGTGRCLDVGCGTGVNAATLRTLGWTPVGLDISTSQLRHARPRLPVACGDATALPVTSGGVPAAVCLLAHTDVDDYAAVVREISRVLAPGGRFVHVGIHPCFTGAFADRTDPGRIVVDAGYHRTERRFQGWSPQGVRARVGATHRPLPALLHTAIDAGLAVVGVAESGPDAGVPDVLGFAAGKGA